MISAHLLRVVSHWMAREDMPRVSSQSRLADERRRVETAQQRCTLLVGKRCMSCKHVRQLALTCDPLDERVVFALDHCLRL
jgi:hypothetical protein